MRRILQQSQTQLAAILLIAAIVRTIGISSRPIWYDEAFAILFAQKGLAAMIYGTLSPTGIGAADIHPLGYYTILWGWISLFGTSLVTVRILSIMAGIGAVILLYLIGTELFSIKIGLLSALLAALAPFQVHYSQEIRMYSFLCVWLLLATYALFKLRRERGLKWWVIFVLSAALAQYTHNLALLYLLPLALTPLLFRDWSWLKKVVLGGLAAIVLYLPWLLQLPSQVEKVANSYWIAPPGFEKFFTQLLVYITNLPLPNGWLMPGLFISLLAFALSLWQTFLAIRQKTREAANGAWLFFMAFAPVILSFLISQWRPIFLERTFIAAGAIFCAWMAWSFFSTGLPRPVQAFITAGLALGAFAGLYQHVSYNGFPYAPYGALQAMLERQAQPGDIIIHSSKLSLLPALYFDQHLNQEFLADPPGGSTDTLALATQKVLGVTSEPTMEQAVGNASRVWFIIFDQSIQEYIDAGQVTHPHIKWLDSHFGMRDFSHWGDLDVFLYEK